MRLLAVVSILCVSLVACGTSQPAGGDAGADCTPFALIPDATEYFYDGSDDASDDASCVGDPACPFVYPYACDAGPGQRHPAGTEAVLPTTSGSDLNCRSGEGDLCACVPLTCTCAYDGPGHWYCPN